MFDLVHDAKMTTQVVHEVRPESHSKTPCWYVKIRDGIEWSYYILLDCTEAQLASVSKDKVTRDVKVVWLGGATSVKIGDRYIPVFRAG